MADLIRRLDVASLSYREGRLVGQLLAACGAGDVVDAHVAILARERDWPAGRDV